MTKKDLTFICSVSIIMLLRLTRCFFLSHMIKGTWKLFDHDDTNNDKNLQNNGLCHPSRYQSKIERKQKQW